MKSERTLGGKLTHGDLMKVFWHAFILPACYSLDRMQAPGFAYSMIPVLKKLYQTKDRLSTALLRHSEVYNCTYAVAPFILGIASSMEEEAASNEDFDTTAINAIKVALMGPLAGIGDTFFWGTFRVIAAGVGTSLALNGNILGPILFFVLYNIPHLLTRYYGLFLGYKLGSNSIKALAAGGSFEKATKAATVMGLVVIGGMVASMVNVQLGLVFRSGKTVLKFQTIIDEICPKLLPLLTTLGVFGLLKKKVSAGWIMVGIFAIGIVASYFGILK